MDEQSSEHPDQPLRQFEDLNNPTPPDSLLQGELAEKIDAALADLPENQRTALLLCRQEELSYEEMAEILDCSVSAVKSLIHRGRESLKNTLKPYLRTGEWPGQK
jgi:RNA polymerase sigma-70 factor (ECF subfamily)